MEDIDSCGFIFPDTNLISTQINLKNIQCKNVNHFSDADKQYKVPAKVQSYVIDEFSSGLFIDENGKTSKRGYLKINSFRNGLDSLKYNELPSLPLTKSWVNIKALGAVGNGFHDDTEVFKQAIEKYDNIYIPQGWYVVKEPLYLKQNTNLIGLHPASTLILTLGGNENFSGFGAPQPQLIIPHNGNNIVCGLYLNADAYNYRAVNCKWMGSAKSYMFDVKFSGHDKHKFRFNGQIASNPLSEPYIFDLDSSSLIKSAWDNQHWSLWINGGGNFRDIWSANEYSSCGIYVSNTDVEGHFYGVSVEHHLRNEVIFRNVSNWNIYALQIEVEEDGYASQPLDISNCRNITFANLYSYRVSRIKKPFHSAIRLWGRNKITFLNVSNYANENIKFSCDYTLLGSNNRKIINHEISKLVIDERFNQNEIKESEGLNLISSGFNFIDGLALSKNGDIYFCENVSKRIYKYDVKNKLVCPVLDYSWNNSALTFDTQGNLVVIVKYISQPGYDNFDKRCKTKPLFGWRGKGGLWGFKYVPKAYSVNIDNADNSFRTLPLMKIDSLSNRNRLVFPINCTTIPNGDYVQKGAFVALDNITVIPYQNDLYRCSSLSNSKIGDKIFFLDEQNKRISELELDLKGHFVHQNKIIDGGDKAIFFDANYLCVADDKITIYSKKGSLIQTLNVNDRVTSMLIVGHLLYITTPTGLYVCKISR